MKEIDIDGMFSKSIKKHDLMVSFHITQVCNFNCHYCYGNKQGKEARSLTPVKEVIECLKKTNRRCLVVFVGGEVFLIPTFVDICKQLNDAGIRIALETNLSVKDRIEEFANTIDSSKVECIIVSTHILERERRGLLNEYLQSISLLETKGFNIYCNYVLHPLLLKRFRRDYDFFKSKGIKLWPRFFVGIYKNLSYPDAYSSDERELILSANPRAGYQSALKNTAGMLCSAGEAFIVIQEDGWIIRCYGDRTLMGSVYDGVTLFEKSERCPAHICPCWGQHFLVDTKALDKIAESFKNPTRMQVIKKILKKLLTSHQIEILKNTKNLFFR